MYDKNRMLFKVKKISVKEDISERNLPTISHLRFEQN